MDGDLHEWCGVVRIYDFQTLREEGLQLRQFTLDGGSGIQRVCASRQLDPQPRCCLAIDFGDHVVVFATQLNAGHIFQVDH